MAKGPGLFTEIGKQVKDLLTKDYSSDQKFTISSSTATGLALTSTSAKKGRLSFGDVAAQYKRKNVILDVKVDTESNVATTLTVTDILPSAKAIASLKLPDYKLWKAVALKQSPAIDFSATIGTPGISFGAEANYITESNNFAKYNAGLSVMKPNSTASVILADKGDSLRLSYVQNLVQLNGGAVGGEMSRKFSANENTLTVGCSYTVDPHTVVKAKLNNHGNLGALVQHELRSKSFLTISGAFDTKTLEKNPKFGLTLFLKP